MPQPAKLRLSVVVPVYNERDNLSPLTAQILKALTGQVSSFEIIYVDDGSTDGSGPLLDELASYYLEVRVFHFDRNYGQTSAFDAGFHQAGGDLIATLDSDLQYDPADILTLLPLAEHYDLVCGWRKDRHDTLVKRLSSRIANAIRKAVVHDGVHEHVQGPAVDGAGRVQRHEMSQEAGGQVAVSAAPFLDDECGGKIGLFGCVVVEVNGQRVRQAVIGARHRSEERRVGKECRSRWSPYH